MRGFDTTTWTGTELNARTRVDRGSSIRTPMVVSGDRWIPRATFERKRRVVPHGPAGPTHVQPVVGDLSTSSARRRGCGGSSSTCRTPETDNTSHEVQFLSAESPFGSSRRFASPSPIRSQGFSPSQRLHPQMVSRIYFIPHPPLGFQGLQSFVPATQPRALIGARVLSWCSVPQSFGRPHEAGVLELSRQCVMARSYRAERGPYIGRTSAPSTRHHGTRSYSS